MSDRRQAEHAAVAWITRRDRGALTEEETAAFEAWLSASPSHQAAYYRLNSAWQEAGRLRALLGDRTQETAQSDAIQSAASEPVASQPAADQPDIVPSDLIQFNRTAPSSAGRASWGWAIAAGLALVIGGTLVVLQSGMLAREEYSTVVGGLQTVPMLDGSKVTLNTDSRIRVALSEKERRVELEQGEAFFEVAKDPSRPFVVSTGGQRIIAVGTAFSVRREGSDVRVVVTEGKVRMEIPGKESALLEPLAAGSVARTAKDDVLLQTRPSSELEQALSWRSGMLTFRDTPLGDAVAEFNRYNHRQIIIDDPELAGIAVGGIFRATNLDSFVQLLEDGFPVRVIAEGDRFVLRSR